MPDRNRPPARTGLWAGFILTVVALGLLAGAVGGRAGGPDLAVKIGSWLRGPAQFILALTLVAFALVLAWVAWLLVNWALRSIREGPGYGPPAQTRESPRVPPVVYVFLMLLLAGLVALFVWAFRHRGQIIVDNGVGAGPPGPVIPSEPGQPASPLFKLASGIFGVATVVAAGAAAVALITGIVLVFVQRRDEPVETVPPTTSERAPLGPAPVAPVGPGPDCPDIDDLIRRGEVPWDCGDPQAGVLEGYAVFLTVAEASGIDTEGLTPRELASILRDRHAAIAGAIDELTSHYERARYGPYPASPADCRAFGRLFLEVVRYLRSETSNVIPSLRKGDPA